MVRSLSVAALFAFGLLLNCSSDPASDGGGDDTPKNDAGGSSGGHASSTSSSSSGAASSSSSSSGSSSGSNGTTSSSSGTTSSSSGAPAGTDYSVKGPHETTTSSDTVTTDNGCEMAYARYKPADGNPAATVVLAHGFQGSIEDLTDVATHLSSWGFDVVAAPLCSDSFFGTDHAKNGEALAQLAAKLAIAAPHFGGFSAGGLAGFLAAKRVPATVSYLGLDPVDANDLAKAAAPISATVRYILTEPSSCNTQNNFKAAFALQSAAKGVRVVGASHFDVVGGECGGAITDACSFCKQTTDARHEAIVAFATAALLESSGADVTAGAYFTPGQPAYDSRLADGIISAP